jgi:periplasmic copper chaperone A
VSRALPRPAAAAPALALALGLVLTGCGAGFDAQTYQERTVADGANAAVGPIAVRNLTVRPGDDDGILSAGDDAEVRLTLTNDGGEEDRLVEASSPLAESVDLVEGEDQSTVQSVDLPPLGTTGTQNGLLLRSLSEEMRPGRYVEVTLRFERAGEVTVQAPVAVTGEYDEERERSDNFHLPGSDHEE